MRMHSRDQRLDNFREQILEIKDHKSHVPIRPMYLLSLVVQALYEQDARPVADVRDADHRSHGPPPADLEER